MNAESFLEAMRGRAELVLDLARRAGAQQAAVAINRSQFVKAVQRDGEMEQAKASGRQSLALRLFVDGRYGAHSTSDLRDEALGRFVRDAVELTRLLQPDPLRLLPPAALMAQPPGPDLDLFDPGLAQAPADHWLALAEAMDEAVSRRAVDGGLPMVSRQGVAYGEQSHELLAHSDGFVGALSETGCHAGCSVVLLDSGRAATRQSGSWHHLARTMDGLGGTSRADAVAEQAVTRAQRQLGGRPGPTGKATLLVENAAAIKLVADLLSCLSGQAVDQKRSYLSRRRGQAVASPILELRDEPLLPGGLASRWFDAEGLAAQTREVIAAGVLREFFLDTYHAARLGLTPTSGSSSNLLLTPSRAGGLAEMLAETPRGLAVTSFLGGNFNATSGDFSFGARGLWIEDGQVVHPVEGMNIAGNFDDLWRSLAAVGDDVYPYSRLAAPSLMFTEVMLSGA